MDNITKCLNFGYIGHLLLALCLGGLFSYIVLGTKPVNVEGWKCTQVPIVGLARCEAPARFAHLSSSEQAKVFIEMAYRNGFF